MTPFIIIGGWLVCAVVAVAIAHFRNLSIKSWIVLSVLLGPFAIAYALSPDNAASDDWRGRGSSGDGGKANETGGTGCGGGGD